MQRVANEIVLRNLGVAFNAPGLIGASAIEWKRARDLDHAARPRNDCESKAVQLHNRGYQVQTKTQA